MHFCGNPSINLLPQLEFNEFHISFHNHRHILYEPCLYRILCLGVPNCGSERKKKGIPKTEFYSYLRQASLIEDEKVYIIFFNTIIINT